MRRFTHLARSFDLTLPSNAWVIGLTLAAAVAGLVVPGDRTPITAVLQNAGTVFLTWALARELDPDRPLSASLAALAGGAAVVVTGETSLAGLAGLLMGSRILVRTTGLLPLLTDVVAVGVFVGVFARDPIAWATGLMVAAAVAGDTLLPQPAPARNAWLAVAIGVSVTLTVVISDALPRTWEVPDALSLVYAAGGIVAGTTARALPLASTADRGSALLLAVRLRTARGMVVAAATLATLVGGGAFAPKLWPVWLTLIVVGAASRTGLR